MNLRAIACADAIHILAALLGEIDSLLYTSLTLCIVVVRTTSPGGNPGIDTYHVGALQFELY